MKIVMIEMTPMTRATCRSLLVLALLLPVALSLGACRSLPPLEQRVAEVDARANLGAAGSTAESGTRSERKPVYAHRINDYLIYPVQWGTAEDLALTLEPVLQARYGTAARVIPHFPTNKIFIYIPPPGERDQGDLRAPGTRTRGASRGRSPTTRPGTTSRDGGSSRARR